MREPATTPERPVFGAYIRALRLGYGHWKAGRCYVRITDDLDGNWRVDMCPDSQGVPTGRKANSARAGHRAWWESPDGGEAGLRLSPAIVRAAATLTGFVTFLVGDDGEIVNETKGNTK